MWVISHGRRPTLAEERLLLRSEPPSRLSRSVADVAALTSSSQTETGGETGWHALGDALIVFACGFMAAAPLGAHAYRGTHTGFVLCACAPGVEVSCTPGVFMEQCP